MSKSKLDYKGRWHCTEAALSPRFAALFLITDVSNIENKSCVVPRAVLTVPRAVLTVPRAVLTADSAKEKVIAVKIESQVKNGEQYDYDESTKSLN